MFPCSSMQFSGLSIPLSARCVVASGGVPDEPRGRMGCFASVVDLCCLGCCNHISQYFRVSVSIRARPWLAYLPPTRPVPFDTFPIHTRHIPDTYEYSMNTPRILRVYAMNTSKHLLKRVEPKSNSLLSPIAYRLIALSPNRLKNVLLSSYNVRHRAGCRSCRFGA